MVGNDIATGVAFRNVRGQIYFKQFLRDDIDTLSSFLPSGSFSFFHSNNYKFGFDQSVVGLVLESSNNTTSDYLRGVPLLLPSPPFPFLGNSCSAFSWGRNVTNSWSCILTPDSCTFYDSTFSPATSASFTTLYSISQLVYEPTLDKTSGLYITQDIIDGNQVNGLVKYLGVPFCYSGIFDGACSFASIPQVENIPVLESVTQVSLGAWGACANRGGSLSCWGNYPTAFPDNKFWENYTSVSWVSMNNSGACVEYTNQNVLLADCWGALSLTIHNVSLTRNDACDLASDVLYENLCFPCAFGEQLSSLSDSFLQCIPCSSFTVFPAARGPQDSVCQVCNLGSTSSNNLSSCISCPPNSYRSATMLQCLECPPGFQGSLDRLSCEQCSPETARSLGANSCSSCPAGSIPSTDRSSCAGCPQPQILVFSTSYSCRMCDLGQNAYLGQCVSCTVPNFRSVSMMDCSPCPEGSEPSENFTFCVPCAEGKVRKDTSRCYMCPVGTIASDDRTTCISVLRSQTKFFLSPAKTAYVSSGLFVLCATGILVSLKKLTGTQSIVGYFLGALVLAGALLF
jgi:hypothetical protein